MDTSQFNAVKYAYAGWLDSAEVLDFAKPGKQTCQASPSGVKLHDVSEGISTGVKVLVARRASKLTVLDGFDDNGNGVYKTGFAAAYFVSFRSATQKVYVHYGKSSDSINGYDESVLETQAGYGAGDVWKDATSGITITVKSISSSEAVVDADFCGGGNEPCKLLADGASCSVPNSQTTAISVCKVGRCTPFTHTKCGRMIDVVDHNGFESYLAGRYVRDDSRMRNGRASYVKDDGAYDIRPSPTGSWIISKATNAETSGSYFATLMKDTGTSTTADNIYAKDGLVDLAAATVPGFTGYFAHFSHFSGGGTSLATIKLPFCRDNDCDGAGATASGGADCNDNQQSLITGTAEQCKIPTTDCLSGLAEHAPCGTNAAMVQICSAQQNCRKCCSLCLGCTSRLRVDRSEPAPWRAAMSALRKTMCAWRGAGSTG